ncbi:MAG: serine hydrolase domain-containing protein [Gemmatimonadaceae bacterium]
MYRRILALVLLTCGCGRTAPPTPNAATTSSARIERVLRGLRPAIEVAGETPIRWTLAERMAHHKVPGLSVAVIDSGRIVWARGFGVKEAGGTDSVTTETLFQAGSISKPTFALAIMRMVQDGQLSLDENVNAKLTSWKVPENRFTATEKVTLRRILSHNAGLTVHGFPGYEAGTPIPTVVQVLDGKRPANTAPVRVDTFPGAISRYSGGGTTVAMLLLTDVTKKPFPELMQQLVLTPAGMTSSTYEQNLPPDMAAKIATGTYTDGRPVKGRAHIYPEMSAAGLWTTATDLAKLAIELQHTWAGQPGHVVNKATLTQMFTVQKAPFGIGYVLGGTGKDLDFEHNGADEGFQALFVAYAERGQGLFAMANSDNGIDLIKELQAAVADEYQWPSHQTTIKTSIAYDSASFAALAGSYELLGQQRPATFTVSVQGKKALLSIPAFRMDSVELLADSDTSFFLRSDGTPVVAKKDANGRITMLTIAGQVTARKK